MSEVEKKFCQTTASAAVAVLAAVEASMRAVLSLSSNRMTDAFVSAAPLDDAPHAATQNEISSRVEINRNQSS
jgi:hypothetical protein